MPTLRETAQPLYDQLLRIERQQADRFWQLYSEQYNDGVRARGRKSLLQVAHISVNQGIKRLTNLYYAPIFIIFAAGLSLGSANAWIYLVAAVTSPLVVAIVLREIVVTRKISSYFKPAIRAEGQSATPDTDLSGHRWS